MNYKIFIPLFQCPSLKINKKRPVSTVYENKIQKFKDNNKGFQQSREINSFTYKVSVAFSNMLASYDIKFHCHCDMLLMVVLFLN